MHNMALNGLVHRVSFHVGNTAQIFSATANFPPDHTTLIISVVMAL